MIVDAVDPLRVDGAVGRPARPDDGPGDIRHRRAATPNDGGAAWGYRRF